MSHPVKKFQGNEADVTWDARLCIHIGECGRAQGELFVAGRNPWCQPDLVQVGHVADVVRRCPTGALALHRKDGGKPEEADASNVVIATNNGPLYLRGDLEIEGATDDMPGARFRAALCRCGESKNKPFCDNTHEDAKFRDRGAVGESGEDTVASGGKLVVKRAPNGPLLVSGNFTIVAASGREAWRGTKAALCRCGLSKNKPFCDGSHKSGGFEAE